MLHFYENFKNFFFHKFCGEKVFEVLAKVQHLRCETGPFVTQCLTVLRIESHVCQSDSVHLRTALIQTISVTALPETMTPPDAPESVGDKSSAILFHAVSMTLIIFIGFPYLLYLYVKGRPSNKSSYRLVLTLTSATIICLGAYASYRFSTHLSAHSASGIIIIYFLLPIWTLLQYVEVDKVTTMLNQHQMESFRKGISLSLLSVVFPTQWIMGLLNFSNSTFIMYWDIMALCVFVMFVAFYMARFTATLQQLAQKEKLNEDKALLFEEYPVVEHMDTAMDLDESTI